MHALLVSHKRKTVGLLCLLFLVTTAAFYLYFNGFEQDSLSRLKHVFVDLSPEAVATSTPSLASPYPNSTANKEAPNLSAAIVASVKKDTDLTWLSEVNDSMWKLHRYNFDDPNPPPQVWIPKNKGHEAMAYLSYIITNYDSLANYSIFIHGHRHSWHQEGDMVELINNLRIPALERDHYVPLRCDWYPSCPAEIRPVDHDAVVWGPGVHREDAEREIEKAWKALFGDAEIPRTIASQCCAQFAVTREALQRRSKADYERMREWLVGTELIDDISGRVMEKLWAYIMTGETIRCPPPQQCACEYFGQCGPKEWRAPPEGLAKWDE